MKKLNKKRTIMLAIIFVALVVLISMFFISNAFSKKFDYENLETVLAEQESVLENKYENLILPENINIVNPDKLYEIYENMNISNDGSDEAFDKMYPFIRDFTNGYVKEDDVYIGDDNDFRFGDNDGKCKDYIGSVNGDGICDVTSLDAMYVRANMTQHIETISVKNGDNTDVTYDIAGEQYSVKDAIAYCEKYLEEINYENYCPETFELKPSYVVVYRTKGPEPEPSEDAKETYYYAIYFDMYLYGIPLNDSGTINEEKFFSSCKFMMQIDKKDNVGCIQRTAQIDPQRVTELKGKFITLESCLENASEWLSKGYEYEVKEIGMRYCSILEIGFKQRTARPYWRIVLDESFGTEATPVVSTCVYVDVQTGDMYWFNSASGDMITPDD